jgi:signal transduction histidine kinase
MLRTRLFLNLIPFVVILLAVGIFAIMLFSRLAGSVDVTVMDNYRSVTAAQSMEVALLRMQSGVLLVFEQKGDLGQALFEQNRNAFEQDLERLRKRFPLPGEDELRAQIMTNYEAFLRAATKIFSREQPLNQRELYAKDFYPALQTTSGLLEKIRALNHDAILATSQNVQSLTRHVRRLMIIGMAVALVLASYACYNLGRSILEPIQSLTRATRELGEGRLNAPVPVVSDNELGQLASAFNRMAAQLQSYRRSTTEQIMRLHRTMETTLASFPDPIFVLGKEARTDLMNPAAAELAGALQLRGSLPDRLQSTARRVLETGENFLPDKFKEVVSFRLNGSEKFFLPRILAMRDREDALFGVAVVLYDVTRFRLLDDAKTNLVATVSHELKTPLTSVRMVLHLLLENTLGPLSPKQTELLEAARDDAERLLRTLNDLLDLARLEEGGAQLYKEALSPEELLHSVADELRDSVAAKGLTLTTSVASGLSPVNVDRQRIGHVFTNLISNAMKYSPPGGEIVLRATSTDEDEVQFSVIDHGPGVPEEFKSRIFERFFRVPGQNKTGAGLGLSIAREIVLAHGGRIGVRKAPDGGSEFYLVLESAQDAVPVE